MDKIEELIQRAADARKTMQEIRAAEVTARQARVTAEKAYETAQNDLWTEVHGRVDALQPSQEGDRAC